MVYNYFTTNKVLGTNFQEKVVKVGHFIEKQFTYGTLS